MAQPTDPAAVFVYHTERVATLLAKLQHATDDHFGVAPDSIHWGHIGQVQRIQYLLEQAVYMAGGEPHG